MLVTPLIRLSLEVEELLRRHLLLRSLNDEVKIKEERHDGFDVLGEN